MNKEIFAKKINNFKSDCIETALPYVIDMLPDIFVNGLCVSLPAVGNLCLSFKQNRDTRILTAKIQEQENDLSYLKAKVDQLCVSEKKILCERLIDICENEMAHLNDVSSKDVYRVDYMELILDESFEYDFSRFSDFIENLENPYVVSDAGYAWISGNRITINIEGSVMRFSCEFHEIIEYINDLLWDVEVTFIKNPIKFVKCY